MENNNSLKIKSVVDKIADGFLRGYYTASMYELKEIAKQKSFSEDEKKYLERVFMLPNNGAIEVYFSDNNEMIIETRTPQEQEKYATQISRLSYLIKNGYSNIDTTIEYLDIIKRHLKKEEIEITKIIQKGSIALITIVNNNFNLISQNNEDQRIAKIENEELLFAEDKIITARQLQDSFNQGNYTLTLNTIKQLQNREYFTESQQKDLTKTYIQPNKSAVEIYFEDGKLIYEERSYKEQEFYDIQIERLKSLMYGEVDKLSILSRYKKMAVRFFIEHEVEVLTMNKQGVFYEITVTPIIKPVEDDIELAKKRKKEQEEKLKQQKLEEDKKELERRTKIKVEKTKKTRLNIRQRLEALDTPEEEFFSELPVKPAEENEQENKDNNIDNEENKSDNTQKTENQEEPVYIAENNTMNSTMQNQELQQNDANVKENNQANKTITESDESETETTSKNNPPINQSIDNIGTTNINLNDKTYIESVEQKEEKSVIEKPMKALDELDEKLENSNNELKIEDKNIGQENILEEKLPINSQIESRVAHDTVNEPVFKIAETPPHISFKMPENSVNTSSSTTIYTKIDLDDNAQFSRSKTDMFWKLQLLRVKENVNLNYLLDIKSIKNYSIVSPIYNLFVGAADDNSKKSFVENPSGDDFLTFSQLCRMNLINFNKLSQNNIAKKIVSLLLTPTMEYSSTAEFNETIENFLNQPKIKYELKNGLTNLDKAIDIELQDEETNELIECVNEFVNKNKFSLLEVLLSKNENEN